MAWLVSGPVAIASFSLKEAPLHTFLAAAVGANFLLLLILLRLVLGWAYVGDRLQRPTVVYEETGWYDGQEWQKPEAELTQDRLIYTYELRPILQRLQVTFLALVIFSLGLALGWALL
jgi:hypothetical protein